MRAGWRRTATWAVLGLALGAGTAYLMVRLLLPSDGGRIAFYAGAWSPEGIAIAPVDAPASGLRGGDVVAAVADVPMSAWAERILDAQADRPGPTTTYRIDRAGTPVNVTITWTTTPLGATLLDGWGVVAFSIGFALVAAFVFARRPDEPAAAALVLAAAGASGSSVPWFLGATTSDLVLGGPFLLHSLVTGPIYMLLWPAGLHLALVFPTRPGLVARHRRLIPAVYATTFAAYAVGLVLARLGTSTTVEWFGMWPLVQVAIIVPIVALTVLRLVAAYAGTSDPAARTRLRWATIGAVVSASLGLGTFMLPELILRHPLVPDSWIGIIALPVPLGLAAGILRDRLFDIEVVVNRALVYGGLTLGVIVSYLAVASAITTVAGGGQGYGASLLATGAAALAALPLRDVLQRSVNRLMYGQRDEPWRAMRRLGQRLTWAADPERAFPAITDTVADTLRIPYVALRLGPVDPGSMIVAQHGSPGGATIAVPLIHAAEVVGSLELGLRSGERSFRDDELRLLEDLGRQAGAAIDALRLREDLARSRERLVLAREEERRRLRRDLHDGLGPSLAGIGMRAEAAGASLASDPDAARRLLDDLSAEVRTLLGDVRRLVDDLRPPALDDVGLLAAIRQQADRLDGGPNVAGGRRPTRIVVEASGWDARGAGAARDPARAAGSSLPELPAAVEVAAYRIAVEAMTNVVRHARATTCRVVLRADDSLSVEVIDDGCGIPAAPRAGVGLESMRERADEVGGSLTIEPIAPRGTRVLARLPVVRAPGTERALR